MSTTTLSKSIFINASRETVWSFLVDKDKLGEWYHPAERDLALGEDYTLYRLADDDQRVRQVWGTVLEMESPSRLVSTFIIGPFGDKETTLTWVLDATVGGTRLSLTHDGIAEATGDAALQLLMALDQGWDKHFADLRTAAAP